MTDKIYSSVAQYLEALKAALSGAPQGLIADALADCEEHLRGAIAAHPEKSEAEVFADMAKTYGSPQEVAAEYRAMETPPAGPFSRPQSETVMPETAAAPRRWTMFNVYSDPHTYGALVYMLLALATGIFYFTWAVVGCSLTVGLGVLIIGLPFFMLFVASVRLLGLLEGRVVEALLGVRMPRRLPANFDTGFWKRIGDAFTDLRTWSSLAYMFLMLPLGIFYFVVAVVGLALSLALSFGGIWTLFDGGRHFQVVDGLGWVDGFAHNPLAGILFTAIGMVLFFLTLHLARLIGWLHGRIAEHLLVRL
jgi:uncharacterized membrane protein